MKINNIKDIYKVKINKDYYWVSKDEFTIDTKLLPEFNGLRIYKNLDIFERNIGLMLELVEMFFEESKKENINVDVHFEFNNSTHGGYFPFQLTKSMLYNIHNNDLFTLSSNKINFDVKINKLNSIHKSNIEKNLLIHKQLKEKIKIHIDDIDICSTNKISQLSMPECKNIENIENIFDISSCSKLCQRHNENTLQFRRIAIKIYESEQIGYNFLMELDKNEANNYLNSYIYFIPILSDNIKYINILKNKFTNIYHLLDSNYFLCFNDYSSIVSPKENTHQDRRIVINELIYNRFKWCCKKNNDEQIIELDYNNLLELCMIVKNSGAEFENILRNNLKYFDHWTIFDTGSTDGTQNIIRKVTSEKNMPPGKLIEDNIPIEEFHFADARNKCIEEAGHRCKFIVTLDDTYKLNGDVRYIFKYIRGDQFADSYNIYIESNDVLYTSNRIIKTEKDLRYIYRIHEVINDANNRMIILPYEIISIIDVQNNYMEKRTFERKKYDLLWLQEEINNNPHNPKHYYYIAQTYKCLKDYNNAYYFYLKRGEFFNSGFTQERYDAIFEAARLANFELNKAWNDCLSLYKKAIEIDDTRPDAYYFIGIHYIIHEKNIFNAYINLKKAYELGIPINSQYSIKPTLTYCYVPLYLARVCYEIKDYMLGQNTCQFFLNNYKSFLNKLTATSNFELINYMNNQVITEIKSWYKIFTILNSDDKINLIYEFEQIMNSYALETIEFQQCEIANKKPIALIITSDRKFSINNLFINLLKNTHQVIVFCKNCIIKDIHDYYYFDDSNDHDNNYNDFNQNFTYDYICGILFISLKYLNTFCKTYYSNVCFLINNYEYIPALINGNVDNIYIINSHLSDKKSNLLENEKNERYNHECNIFINSPKIKSILCLSTIEKENFIKTFTNIQCVIDCVNFYSPEQRNKDPVAQSNLQPDLLYHERMTINDNNHLSHISDENSKKMEIEIEETETETYISNKSFIQLFDINDNYSSIFKTNNEKTVNSLSNDTTEDPQSYNNKKYIEQLIDNLSNMINQSKKEYQYKNLYNGIRNISSFNDKKNIEDWNIFITDLLIKKISKPLINILEVNSCNGVGICEIFKLVSDIFNIYSPQKKMDINGDLNKSNDVKNIRTQLFVVDNFVNKLLLKENVNYNSFLINNFKMVLNNILNLYSPDKTNLFYYNESANNQFNLEDNSKLINTKNDKEEIDSLSSNQSSTPLSSNLPNFFLYFDKSLLSLYNGWINNDIKMNIISYFCNSNKYGVYYDLKILYSLLDENGILIINVDNDKKDVIQIFTDETIKNNTKLYDYRKNNDDQIFVIVKIST